MAGLLLKPGYPATPAEVVFGKRADHVWAPGLGEVNVAYSTLGQQTWAVVIGIDVPQTVGLTGEDLGYGDQELLVWTASKGVAGHSQRTASLPFTSKYDVAKKCFFFGWGGLGLGFAFAI